jgi:hypothetical protein
MKQIKRITGELLFKCEEKEFKKKIEENRYLLYKADLGWANLWGTFK